MNEIHTSPNGRFNILKVHIIDPPISCSKCFYLNVEEEA